MSLRIVKGSVKVEKSDNTTSDGSAVDVQTGEQHLHELEVDVRTVLQEKGEFDFESDQSPFPEGNFLRRHLMPMGICLTFQCAP